MGYSKLFAEIVMSTVWRESDHVRILWITMLAIKDRWHIVNSSLPGLADAARISIPACEEAIRRLESPDKYSRSIEFDGRRIEKCEGGWVILNGEKYRNKMSLDERREYNRIKQKEYYRKNKNLKSSVQGSTNQTHTDTDTDSDTKKTLTTLSSSEKPNIDDGTEKRDFKLEAKDILEFLNLKTGRHYRMVVVNLGLIEARLKVATKKQCRQIIALKAREWREDPKMNKFLRPATLFNKTKFEQYIGELIHVDPEEMS